MRRLLWGVALLAAGTAVGGILLDAQSDRLVLPALAATLWAVFLLGIAYSFASVPGTLKPGEPLKHRVGTRLKRGFLWVLAVLVGVLATALLGFTFRVFGLIVD